MKYNLLFLPVLFVVVFSTGLKAQMPSPPVSANLFKKIIRNDSTNVIRTSFNIHDTTNLVSPTGQYRLSCAIRLADTLSGGAINVKLGTQTDDNDLSQVTYSLAQQNTALNYRKGNVVYLDFGIYTNPPKTTYLTVRVSNQAGLTSSPKVFIMH